MNQQEEAEDKRKIAVRLRGLDGRRGAAGEDKNGEDKRLEKIRMGNGF